MADSTLSTGGGDILGMGGVGAGGGLIGGIILGALLNGNNGLFGNRNGAVDPQAQANMSLMQSIGAVDKSVAVNQAAMEASQATQTGMLSNQMSSVAAALTSTVTSQAMQTNGAIAGVKDSVNGNAVALMNMINGVDKTVLQAQNSIQTAITTDGDKTRALLTSQYEANLQRELVAAQNEISELQNDRRIADATSSISVNTTNNINQAQAQQQQQQQFQYLAGLVGNLANDLQYIRATNQAINIGTGTQTANPANTNTNVRA